MKSPRWMQAILGAMVLVAGPVAAQDILHPLPGSTIPSRPQPPIPLAPLPAPTRVPPRNLGGSPPGAAMRPAVPAPVQESVFGWDALMKELTLKPGETEARFSFTLTNTSPAEVTISAVRTSCGCTVPKLPSVPWKIAAGASGTFELKVDVRGKIGVLTKTATVESSAGYRYLTVRVSVPAAPPGPMTAANRARNIQASLADRSAVFRSDCATCHVTPGVGRRGHELFTSVCGVCHEAEHRATMVPNLHALSQPQPADHWRKWITEGKEGTLMPAWSSANGGPLTAEQIDSLVDYLTGPFATEGPATARPVSNIPAPH